MPNDPEAPRLRVAARTQHRRNKRDIEMQQQADLLKGAKAIAEFLAMTEKQARHRIEAGIIPVFRLPGDSTIYARRSTLTTWLAECEAAARQPAIAPNAE